MSIDMFVVVAIVASTFLATANIKKNIRSIISSPSIIFYIE
jgi:hypothetical protein